jgi:molybdopterin converting factor small subunit
MTGVQVTLPRMLASEAGGSRHLLVTVDATAGAATDLACILQSLAQDFPILGRRLRDETGELRRFVNIYLDGEDIRRLNGLATPVLDGQTIQIIQSVAGG